MLPIILALFLRIMVAAIPYATYTDTLDPAPILYPNGWYPNNIELSSNHAGQKVTVTIYCNVAADLNPGSIVTMAIPGFTNSPFTSNLITELQPSTSNNIFIFTLTLPPITSNTAYEPISIVIYNPYSPNGDILARNAAYGSIVVLTAKLGSSSSGLAVSYLLTPVFAASPVSITLNFSLQFVLHNNDYCVLTVPSNFNVLAQSLNFTTNNNTSNIGNQYFIGALSSAAGNLVTVYQLKAFNNTITVPVSFNIGGLRTPNYVSTSFAWTLEFFRFGTRTTIFLLGGTGPASGLLPGVITVSNWRPANGYLPYVVNGIQTFTNFTMATSHDIPQGGTIVVAFSDIIINNGYIAASGLQSLSTRATGNYAFATPSSSFILEGPDGPSFEASALTITTSSLIPASTTIVIVTLSSFTSSSPRISGISTTDISGNTIDSLGGPYSAINYKSSGFNAILSMSTYIVEISNTQGSYNFGVSYIAQDPPVKFGLYFGAVSKAILSANTNITLSGPFSLDATVQDDLISFNSGLASVGTMTANINYLSAATYSNGYPRSFTFKNSANSSSINILLYAGTSTGSDSLPTQASLPNFASNIYTRYEVCFQYTVDGTVSYSTQETYAYCQPLTIAMGPDDSSFSLFCSSAGMRGITGTFFVSPYKNLEAIGTNSLTINFQISAQGDPNFRQDLMTGLTSGSNLPTSMSNSQSFYVWYSGGNPYITTPPTDINIAIWWGSAVPYMTNINCTSTASPPSFPSTGIGFYLPFHTLARSTVYGIRYYIYFLRNSDNTRFIVQTGTGSIIGSSRSLFTPSTAVQGDSITVPLATSFSLDIPFAATVNLHNDFASIVLPQGFQINTPTISINGNTDDNLKLFSFTSTTPSYGYPSVLLLNATINDSDIVTLTGVSSPFWVPADTFISIASIADSICTNLAINYLKLETPALTVISLDPADGGSLGLSDYPNQLFELSLTVTASGPIIGDPSSSININTGINATFPASYSITAGSFTTTGTYTGTGFTSSGIISSLLASTSISILLSNVPFTNTTLSGFTYISINYLGGVQYSATISQSFTLVYTPVGSSISSVNVFPNTAKAINVHFEINFSPSIYVPAYSTILISGDLFSKDSNIGNNTWCSVGFNGLPVIVSSKLQLTTRVSSNSDSTITIRKDLAFTNPFNGNPWSITITNPGGIIIVSDTTGSHAISYASSPLGISTAVMTANITNAGETSYYTFSFKLSFNLLPSYSIVIDVPFYYDAYFGPITLNKNNNLYYLTATSTVSSSSICTVGHWIITCNLGVQIKFGSSIDISVLGINPSNTVNSLSSTQGFSLCIVDASSTIKALNQYIPNIILTPPPTPFVHLDSIIITSNQSFSSDYKFVLFSSETYNALSTISIMFPAQYNFAKDQTASASTINNACSSIYFTVTGSTTSVSNLCLPPCTLSSNNLATFTFSAAVTPGKANEIHLKLKSITNPTISSSYTSSIENTYNVKLGAVISEYLAPYDFWTGKFTLYTATNSSANSWISRSYGNANAAFLGFSAANLKSLSLNGGSNIYLNPGTYSYYTVSTDTGTVDATQLVLTPTLSNLTFKPIYLTLNYTVRSGRLQVGTSISTVSGIYNIVWTILETPAIANKYLYLATVKTQINITSTSIPISAPTSSSVPNWGESLPIMLSILPYYTYSNFTLKFTLSIKDTPITFNPPLLVYNSSLNTLGFQVVNPSSLAPANYTIAVSIEGTDAAAYSVPSPIELSVGVIVSGITLRNLTLASLTPSILSVYVESSGPAKIYWIISTSYSYSLNPSYSSLKYVQQYAYPINGLPFTLTQSPLSAQYTAYNNSINNKIAMATDYSAYNASLLPMANNISFIAMDSIPQGSTNYSTIIYGLLAYTSYTITVWADNLVGNIVSINGNITTSYPGISILSFSLWSISSNPSSVLSTILANITKQPAFLFNNISLTPSDSSTIVTVLIFPSYANTISTSTIANSVINHLPALVENLAVLGIAALGVTATSLYVPCPPGYSGVNVNNTIQCFVCKRYINQSVIVSANYSSDFKYIYVNFSVTISPISSCQNLTLSASVLGTGANCSINTSNQAIIALGSNWSLLNSPLILNGYSLYYSDTSIPCTTIIPDLSINVTHNITNSTPVPSITGPTTIYIACSDEILLSYSAAAVDAIGLGLTYAWSLYPVLMVDPTNYLVLQTGTRILLNPSDYIPQNYTGNVYLAVNVTNIFNESAIYNLSIYVSNSQNIVVSIDPSIHITNTASITLSIDSDAIISMSNQYDATFNANLLITCGITDTFIYYWTYIPINDTNPDPSLSKLSSTNNLYLKKGILKAGYAYKFSVMVMVNSISQTSQITVYIFQVPLIVALDYSQFMSPKANLTISASRSFDPNNSTASLEYSWLCYIGTARCTADLNTFVTNQTTPSITISNSYYYSNDILLFNILNITVNIISKNIKGTSTANVTFDPDIGFLSTIQFPRTKIPLSSNFDAPSNILILNSTLSPDLAFSWTVSTGQELIPNYYPFLFIKEGTLKLGGHYYIFNLAINDGIKIYNNVFEIKTNIGAYCSFMNVNKRTGAAFLDLFYFIASCIDGDGEDYPLFSSLGYLLPDGTIQYFITGGTPSYLGTMLPCGNFTILYSVCDSLNDCDSNVFNISTYEKTLDYETAYYNDVALSLENIPADIITVCRTYNLQISFLNVLLKDLFIYVAYQQSNNPYLVQKIFNTLSALINVNQIPSIDSNFKSSIYTYAYSIITKSDLKLDNNTVNAITLFCQNLVLIDKNDLTLISYARDIQTALIEQIFSTKYPGYSAATLLGTLSTKKYSLAYSELKNRSISILGIDIVVPDLNLSPSTVTNILVSKYKNLNNDSDVIDLTISTQGEFIDYNYNRTPEKYIGKLPTSISITMKAYKNITQSYLCGFLDINFMYNTDSCKVKSVVYSNATRTVVVTFEVSHLSLFSLLDFPLSSCGHNNAPFLILVSIFLTEIFIMLFGFFMDKRNARMESELLQQQEMDQEQDQIQGKRIIGWSSVKSSDEKPLKSSASVDRLENPGEKFPSVEESIFTSIIEGHLIFGLFIYRPIFKRLLRALTVFTIIILQLALEGFFIEVFEDYTYGTYMDIQSLFDKYTWNYFGYTAFAITISIPIEIFFIYVFSYKKENSIWLYAISLLFAFIINIGSAIGIFILTFNFCSQWSGFWAVSFFWSILIEIFFLQFIYMIGRYRIILKSKTKVHPAS